MLWRPSLALCLLLATSCTNGSQPAQVDDSAKAIPVAEPKPPVSGDEQCLVLTEKQVLDFGFAFEAIAKKTRAEVGMPMGPKADHTFAVNIQAAVRERAKNSGVNERPAFEILSKFYQGAIPVIAELAEVTDKLKAAGSADIPRILAGGNKETVRRLVQYSKRLTEINTNLKTRYAHIDGPARADARTLGYCDATAQEVAKMVKHLLWSKDLERVRDRDIAFLSAYTELMELLLATWGDWKLHPNGKVSFGDNASQKRFAQLQKQLGVVFADARPR